MALLESEMKGKDQMISELRGIVVELADAVAKRERYAQWCQAYAQDQGGWHKEELERLHARVAALGAELEACRRPPLQPISALHSTSGYQPCQGQKGLGGRCGHGKTTNGEQGKWSRWEYMGEKET